MPSMYSEVYNVSEGCLAYLSYAPVLPQLIEHRLETGGSFF